MARSPYSAALTACPEVSYALVDNTVILDSLVSTKMAGDPKLMELESNLAKTLASIDTFQVFGNELMLSSKGTVVAKFHSGP